MKVINLFAGPGAGKSTTAAGLFYIMKNMNLNVELVSEYAKDLTWEGRHTILEDQLYILAKQNHRLRRLVGQVDWVITDSPLLLCKFYGSFFAHTSQYLPLIVEDIWRGYDNVSYFLERGDRRYMQVGRNQTHEEAKEYDDKIRSVLDATGVEYTPVDASKDAVGAIIEDLFSNAIN